MNNFKFKRTDWNMMNRIIMLIVLDALAVLFSYFAALLARFDFMISKIPVHYLEGYLESMPLWILMTCAVFFMMRLYHSIWRFVGISELSKVTIAYIVLVPIYMVIIVATGMRMPRSYYCIGVVLSFMCTAGIRVSYRMLRHFKSVLLQRHSTQFKDNVMIIGAGRAGQMLIRELMSDMDNNVKLCCAIDDNPAKEGRMLEGIPIVGDRYQIPKMVAKYEITRIIYAIPANSTEAQREILNICKDTGCKLQKVPSLTQIMKGEVSITSLREVELEDLLGREPVKVNNKEILEKLHGKIVMVTGGGGSIGSELVRQIAKVAPKALIIFDIYENNVYDIQTELMREYPNVTLHARIGSVRDMKTVESVVSQYKPDVIFHAAAHKHVPLMEDSPNEAIKNNVFGTLNMAKTADKYGVSKFVLISTDKAVNPTNIMGASKRLCEMIIQMMSKKSNTQFVAVRFGNVLGSNGSVIPLFKKQISEGGPVTVTDKNIIRYFMTIPEAVSLILQATAYAKGGEIFVLDMGKPVKIDDMARNLIRLSGYVPDVDIEVRYIGLRPGEKLYEELLMEEEGLQDTANKLIHIGKPIEMDEEKLNGQLDELRELLATEPDSREICLRIKELVPTYQMKEE